MAALKAYNKPLSQADTLHLLRRCTFVNSWPSIKKYTGKNSGDVVDDLLNNVSKAPTPSPPAWHADAFQNWWRKPQAERQAAIDLIYKTLYEQNYELKRWWMAQMTTDEASIREKMTLFWHGHFTTKFAIDQIMPAQLMYKQNAFFRANALGNFKDLVKGICRDGAMTIFLNSNDSTAKAPNENFSRELLELYTCGIGHYTEADIKEGAKVFTGLRINYYTDEWAHIGVYKPFIDSSNHDFSTKNFLGEKITGSEYTTADDVLHKEIDKLVDIIFKKKGRETAVFLATKLLRYFVYANDKEIDPDYINDLADVLEKNNFEVKPTLSALLKSSFFFDPDNRGVQIKTPAESIVGITKHFDVKADWKEWVMVTMGQELLNPPTVAGWPGYRKWLDTRTYPFSVQQMSYFIYNQTDDYLVNWVAQFDNKEDPKKLVEQIALLFLAIKPTDAQLNDYMQWLLWGAPEYEWTNMLKTKANAANRLKTFLIKLSKLPDFHLN